MICSVVFMGLTGFAFLNWMAKANLIGGIYSRYVVIDNFEHFLKGFLSLIKIVANPCAQSGIIIILMIGYGFFPILFGYVF